MCGHDDGASDYPVDMRSANATVPVWGRSNAPAATRLLGANLLCGPFGGLVVDMCGR